MEYMSSTEIPTKEDRAEQKGLTVRSASLVVAVVLIMLSAGNFFTNRTVAQELPLPPSPFGGRIIDVTACSCSAGFRLTIGPPVPAENIVVQLGVTKIFMWWQVFRPGPWTLGLWQTGGVCKVYSGKGCTELDVEGTVLIIGTSL